jgi:hypothetical protein
MDAVALYQENECDSFISIDGGSSHDACKGARISVAHDGRSVNEFEGFNKMSREDSEGPSPTHQLGCHFLCRGLQPGQVPHDPHPAAVLGVVGQIATAQPP